MLDSYMVIAKETRLIEISTIVMCLLGFIFYFYPNTVPLWVNGLFKPNRKRIKEAGYKFILKHTDDPVYSIFKFKHGQDHLELDKRLHDWLLRTRYHDIYLSKKMGIFYIVNLASCFRKLTVSNVEDMVTNNIELNSLKLLEINSGVFGLKMEDIRIEFRIRTFMDGMMWDKESLYYIKNNLEKWTRLCDEWHNVRVIQELLDKMGMIEVYNKDKVIYRRYGLVGLEMIDPEGKVVNIGIETSNRLIKESSDK